MIVPFEYVLILAMALFVLGAACTVARRTVLMILVGVEIMLNASAIVFVAAALHWGNLDGQAVFIIILGLAAAEVAFGLALLVHVRRFNGSVTADDYAALKG